MSAPASGAAKRIVRRLITDLRNRKGLRQEWDQIDDETKAEIEETWCAAVDEVLTDENR